MEKTLDLEKIRSQIEKILHPIKTIDGKTKADKDFLFTAKESQASKSLPSKYLLYFMLVDLLGFRNLGRFEKIAWSVPVDYNGKAFLIEMRKMGLGIFVHDLDEDDEASKIIAEKLKVAVKIAMPYFSSLAGIAISKSEVNVVNNCHYLFEKYNYFLKSYEKSQKEDSESFEAKYIPNYKSLETGWLALSVMDSFFSWTEHVFIHIWILSKSIVSTEKIDELSRSDWGAKFKSALSLDEPEIMINYTKLVEIRKHLRNHIAHGAFGKEGRAFHFHSVIGAVPIRLTHSKENPFEITEEMEFDDLEVIDVLKSFINLLWSGKRKCLYIYLQSYNFPTILTMVADGSYSKAMKSEKKMKAFVDELEGRVNRVRNMDW